MKSVIKLLPLLLLLGGANSFAWQIDGKVYCDVDQSLTFTDADTPFAGVAVNFDDWNGGAPGSWGVPVYTDENGYYYKPVTSGTEYKVYLDPTTLPPDAVIIDPALGYAVVSPTSKENHFTVNFLVDSATCRTPPEGCWMTGGGVKFEPVTKENYAQHGPKDTMGGVICYQGELCPARPERHHGWRDISSLFG
jgi:hypothetical protein